MSRLHENQVGIYNSSSYNIFESYINRREIRSYPFQLSIVVNSSYVLIDSSLLSGNLSVFPGSIQNTGEIVVTSLSGSVGTASTINETDVNGFILNKIDIQSASTNDSIYDSLGRRVFGLLQCSSTTTDGDPVGPIGSENIQISFVVFDNIQTLINVSINEIIEFTYNKIYAIKELPSLLVNNSTPVDILKDKSITVVDSISLAETTDAKKGSILYVKETDTLYNYISDGSSYIRDGYNYLNTFNSGSTRWIAFAGKYSQSIRENLVETHNGFNLRLDPTSVPDLSWNNGTRTLYVTPKTIPGHSYYFYKGKYVEFSTIKNIQISDVTGKHFIYIDGDGILQEIVNPISDYFEEEIADKLYIAFISWNKVQQKAVNVRNEIHGMMNLDTHLYLQERDGTIYINGLQAITEADGDGSLDTHAQITSYSNGRIQDKDIIINIVDGSPQQLSDPAMLPVVYRLGLCSSRTRKGYFRLPVPMGVHNES